MAIEILTPATQSEFVTLQEIKDELGISGSAEDEILARYRARVQSTIIELLGRPFALATYQETLPGSGSTKLLLSRIPIIAVTEVLVNSQPLTDYTVEDAGAGMLFRKNGWTATGLPRWYIVPTVQPGDIDINFAITYSAGYLMFEDDSPTLPDYWNQIALEGVVMLWNKRGESANLRSKKVGDMAEVYSGSTDLRGYLTERIPWGVV